MKEIGCFISSHGLGHAMRTAAILEELIENRPDVHPHLFTTTAKHLFTPPLDSFTYHHTETDLGLVQSSAFQTDIALTIQKLDTFLPYNEVLLNDLAEKCRDFSFILCDISPMGIVVAQRAGIPSVLIENFTWDWIYEPYIHQNPALQKHANHFSNLFKQATYLIQTEPLCKVKNSDLRCGPISRKVRTKPEHIRRQLGYEKGNTILISMGGLPFDISLPENLTTFCDYQFILAGQQTTEKIYDNLITLDKNTSIYHPDLINSVDLVICKSGYSTISECYQARTPLACVSRAIFPESKIMESFVKVHMGGESFTEDEFITGKWLSFLERLTGTDMPPPSYNNGAEKACRLLRSLL